MRILIALTYYRPHYSGLTIYTEREARALSDRGHKVTVLTSRFDPNLPFFQKVDGIEIVRPRVWVHISKGVIMPSILYWAWKYLRQADIVHLHAPQLDAAPIAMLARLLGKPVVLTYHCDLHLPPRFVHRLANKVSDIANHITARFANVIVHNTQDYAENSPFLRRYLPKVCAIPTPIDLEPASETDLLTFRQKHNIQPGEKMIGIAARLATEKGVEYLAEALPKVLKVHPTARVLMVGPFQNVVGEEEYYLRMKPLLDQLGAHWRFLGVVQPKEMTAFFENCDVTVLPSINSTESYGMVQVESMACGTPVIASDLPGVRVPVMQSGMGVVVPVQNAAALAEALIAVLDRPESYRGHPEQLLAASSLSAVAEAYESLFVQLISKAPVPSRPGSQ